MSTVSVIIPTCNRAARLERALRSVLAQRHPPLEVIVVDDGSTDPTRAVVMEAGAAVRYHYQENRGVSAARNAGIRLASGQWLAFLDSDDEWLPDKLGKQLAAAWQHPDCPLIHTDEIWIRHGRRVNPRQRHRKHGGHIFHHCLPLCAISPSSAMIRRELFTTVGLFDETLPACEDYDMWLRICHRYPVHYLDEPLIIKYGGHEDQLSRRYWGMDRFRIRALVKILQSPTLDEAQRQAVVETLRAKARVYLQGARKRNRHDEVRHYESLLRQYGAACPS